MDKTTPELSDTVSRKWSSKEREAFVQVVMMFCYQVAEWRTEGQVGALNYLLLVYGVVRRYLSRRGQLSQQPAGCWPPLGLLELVIHRISFSS